MKRVRAALVAVGLLAASMTLAGEARADTRICEQYGTTTIKGGRYVVQNNRWGAETAQCIDVTTSGFRIVTANHDKPTNGAPASYPSAFRGCHYGTCSTDSRLPLRVDDIRSATTSIDLTYTDSGTYNAAYDIWLDPTPRTTGQNGTEVMIWLNRQGPIQPIGSRVGTAQISGRTWEVWSGNVGWNVVSYVAPSAINRGAFDLRAFIEDVRSRGAVTNDWYLTSVQAGFEPWVGGAGLAVNDFGVSINGSPK